MKPIILDEADDEAYYDYLLLLYIFADQFLMEDTSISIKKP